MPATNDAKPLDSRRTDEAPVDALTLLETDHAAVQVMFDRFENQKNSSASLKTLRPLAEEILHALRVHAQIEEEIFYPAVREACDDCADLLDEAEVDHAEVKHLIAAIEQDPDSFDDRIHVLAEDVEDHVDEEQHKLFPMVRGTNLDLNALGKQLAMRKKELMSIPPAKKPATA